MRVKLTTKEFINRAKLVHGNKYVYFKCNYNGCFHKIAIICPKHGEFYQIANLHLRGRGCPKCQKNEKIRTTDEFINRAKKVHGGFYNYSLVKFEHSFKEVIIICPKHGAFLQIPNKHLQRHGCQKCNFSKGECKITAWLNNNKLNYIFQKTFDGCKNPKTHKKLKYDFYIPSQNLLIEYDGQQHFHDISTNTFKRESLQDVIYRDNIKNEYAKNKNINLLRINYEQFNNIDNILKRNLI